MEDEVDETQKLAVKMGADNNPSSTSRLVSLQSRKQTLEEKIVLKNKELRRLCIQEAELTGVMPAEIPLEPGEVLPAIRRRVGTAFELPQNIINKLCNEEESIPTLEAQIQVQGKIAEAALQLANNATINKSMKRKNMSRYNQIKQQLNRMEERLETLKSQAHSYQSNYQNQHLKQKKKPRPPLESDSCSNKSSNLSQGDDTSSNRIVHVFRTDQNHLVNSDTETDRYMMSKHNIMYKNSNPYLMEDDMHNANCQNFTVPEDGLVIGMNRMAVNSYGGAKDRKDSESVPYPHSQSNPNIYQNQQILVPNTHTLPHMSHASPSSQYHQTTAASHPNLNFPIHPHTLQHPNSRVRLHAEEPARKYTTENYRNGYNQDTYSYYNPHSSFPAMPVHKQFGYMETNGFVHVVNPHHILSQQQYEPDTSSAGHAGYWVKTETGEMLWCSSMPHEDVANTWQQNKRFGSLDRRKGNHLPGKRTSPCPDTVNKQSTIRSVTNSQQELPRQMTLHPPPVTNTVRHGRHDNRQLVRTQSLGSVGAQTIDSVWPSDDNSSYDSDGHSINELNAASRKLKQKGWCETSLDGPTKPSSQHIVTVQEELHHVPLSPHSSMPSPCTPKSVLEIPAESNPSPMQSDNNVELYNNNVLSDLPKNCTVVQAGQCKPYREVTKPFEMSDFYKYSTKFRERNQEKQSPNPENVSDVNRTAEMHFGSPQMSVILRQDQGEGQAEADDVFQKVVYQPLQPMKCHPLSPPNSFNRSYSSIGSPMNENANGSLDTSLALNTSNVAEHFSAEMNAWYQAHGQLVLDNNNPSTSPNFYIPLNIRYNG
ncbi:stepping stone [Carabus blaptoides fortunei]